MNINTYNPIKCQMRIVNTMRIVEGGLTRIFHGTINISVILLLINCAKSPAPVSKNINFPSSMVKIYQT